VNLLIPNLGSTSLKYQILEMPSEKVLAKGRLERVANYREAIRQVDAGETRIDGIALKAVLAGPRYRGTFVVDDAVVDALRQFLPVPVDGLIAEFGEGATPESVVGRGTGVDDAGLARKRAVVQLALDRVARAGSRDAMHTLAELGGLEIAAITGFYLEAARQGVPVMLDGYIATAAALSAAAIQPAVADWMLAAHASAESGQRFALEKLKLEPLLDFGLRLGEGTGAVLALAVVRAALALHARMATFGEAGVSGSITESK